MLQALESYGSISNFAVNFSKSEALGFAIPDSLFNEIKEGLPFQLAKSYLKYLGTRIPLVLDRILELCFPPLLRSIMRWMSYAASALFSAHPSH